MAVKAYVLVETRVGKTKEVVNAIRRMEGVLSADAVTGPYDAIATVEGENLTAVGHLITEKFDSITGVTRTVTCVAVEIS
jgi:DNA-binding Lrp family transcriptional regulator